MGEPQWGAEEISSQCADFVLDIALLMACTYVRKAGNKAVVKPESNKQLRLLDDIAQPLGNARGIVKYDHCGDTTDELKEVQQALADALSVLTGKNLIDGDIAVRKRDDQVVLSHVFSVGIDEIGLPKIHLGLPRVPYQLQGTRAIVAPLLVPSCLHILSDENVGTAQLSDPQLVNQVTVHPCGGEPLLVIIVLLLFQKIIDDWFVRIQLTRPCLLGHIIHTQAKIIFFDVFVYRLAIIASHFLDLGYGTSFSVHVLDILYLGHFQHSPFNSFS